MIKIRETYIVKKGDTLYGISNQYGVSVTELAEINNIKGSNLDVGQELIIPIKKGNNPNNMFMYTVKDGDTLYGIARKYNTTIKEIMDLNYLKDTNLIKGTVIRIPETYTKEEDMFMPNYINYVVKKGDSLYSISKDNNISVDLIIKDNGLENNNLKVGQILRLRIIETELGEIEECYGEEYIPEVNNTNIYIVKKGDSLYSIAKKYNTSVTNILNLNNLKSSNLSIGQEIKIPISNNYVVKKGDSLYSISKMFNKNVDEIKNKNGLTSNTLKIGQTLII